MDSQVISRFCLFVCLGWEEWRAFFTFSCQPLMGILLLEDGFKAFHHKNCLPTLFFRQIMARWRLLIRFWSHIFATMSPKTVMN